MNQRYSPWHIFREIKWFIHRGIHGWAEPDLWSLDAYFCRLLSEAIPVLVEKSHGHACYGCLVQQAGFEGETLCIAHQQCGCWEAYRTMLLDAADVFGRLAADDYFLAGDIWEEEFEDDWNQAMEFLKDWGQTLWN